MSLTTEVVFRRTDTSFDESNCTLYVTTFDTQTPVSTVGWTLTHIQYGVYELVVPLADVKSIYSIEDNATGLITADGVLDVEDAGVTAQEVWEYATRTLTDPPDDGSGDVLFTWTEYQTGHQGDANYVIPDVTVRVFTNNQAIGTPEAKGVTDETGSVQFYLNAGTYYFFRRKSGRNFTNPVTVSVS